MATTTKIADFVEHLAEGVHNFATDTLQIALSNTAPGSETPDPTLSGNGTLANVTEIAYTNYSDDMTVDRVLEGISSDEAGGVYTLDANNLKITAVTGALPTFRYVYIFNQDATAPVDALILLIDNGTPIDLALGESVDLVFNVGGIATIT